MVSGRCTVRMSLSRRIWTEVTRTVVRSLRSPVHSNVFAVRACFSRRKVKHFWHSKGLREAHKHARRHRAPYAPCRVCVAEQDVLRGLSDRHNLCVNLSWTEAPTEVRCTVSSGRRAEAKHSLYTVCGRRCRLTMLSAVRQPPCVGAPEERAVMEGTRTLKA